MVQAAQIKQADSIQIPEIKICELMERMPEKMMDTAKHIFNEADGILDGTKDHELTPEELATYMNKVCDITKGSRCTVEEAREFMDQFGGTLDQEELAERLSYEAMKAMSKKCLPADAEGNLDVHNLIFSK